MATYYSTFQAGARAVSPLHTRANSSDLNRKNRVARYTWNPTAAEVTSQATGDIIELGAPGCPGARIIPELFRIRFNVVTTADFSIPVQLIAIYGAAVPQAVTWTRTTTTATVTTALPHGYVTGQIITVSASSSLPAIVLGVVTITVTGLYTYTFTCLNAGDASGTATIGPAAGQYIPLTTSVSFTHAGIYTGVAASSGDVPALGKTDRLAILFGTLVTKVPVARELYFEVPFHAP